MIQVSPGVSLTILEDLAIRQTDEERAQYRELTGRELVAPDVAAQLYLNRGVCFSFIEPVSNHGAVAAGGFVNIRPGVWQTWFLHTPLAWAQGHRITNLVKDCYATLLNARRIETVTLATRTDARAWYERLGLTYESTACKASASGADLVTYVALRP